MAKLTGKIIKYNQNKKIGFIEGSDKEIYYFENIDSLNIFDTYNINEIVSFVPHFEDVENFNYASDVEKIIEQKIIDEETSRKR